MVTNRMQKFDELVTRELANELRERFPDRFFSLTQVHVSKDLSFAKIWVSAVNDIDGLVKEFQLQAKDIRMVLSKRIVARRVPSLYFVADKTEEKAERIDKLLEEIKK
ncbi:MAG: 30S ribosome-binding factor RbfA [Patescibacteria group bacterium]